MKKLNILGLSYSQTQSGAYALVLSEENGKRRIPIIIGSAEAQSIAIQLEGLNPPRPLTHDLFLGMASAFDIQLLRVNIFKLEEGIFYSEMICKQGESEVKLDARTSDAVALALRFKCAIYTSEEILAKAGIVLDIEEEQADERTENDSENSINEFDELSIDELQDLLKDAIVSENYERASIIRDEIQSRDSEADV